MGFRYGIVSRSTGDMAPDSTDYGTRAPDSIALWHPILSYYGTPCYVFPSSFVDCEIR